MICPMMSHSSWWILLDCLLLVAFIWAWGCCCCLSGSSFRCRCGVPMLSGIDVRLLDIVLRINLMAFARPSSFNRGALVPIVDFLLIYFASMLFRSSSAAAFCLCFDFRTAIFVGIHSNRSNSASIYLHKCSIASSAQIYTPCMSFIDLCVCVKVYKINAQTMVSVFRSMCYNSL